MVLWQTILQQLQQIILNSMFNVHFQDKFRIHLLTICLSMSYTAS